MTVNKETKITKDLAARKITVTREFAASPAEVWKAWTDSRLLDQWWAPKPYKAETKTMNFSNGGQWLYCMVGPDGSRQWCRADFKTVEEEKKFSATDMFCDENGNVNEDFPPMHWNVNFAPADEGTVVTVEITFDTEAGMKKIVEMGFEEGFTAAHGNLDELLAK